MPPKANPRLRDTIIAAAIFIITFLIFWFSPVHQVTDSNYSMLLSDCLLRQHTFALDDCKVPLLEPIPLANYITNGGIYQLEIARNRVYYFFPVGSSVLSIPYIGAAKLFGVSVTNPDGSFNPLGELTIELSLAALLMALLSSLFFLSARFVLPVGWSVVVALGGSLGTQIWSTASRGLWSHTWTALLAGVLIYLLVAQEKGQKKLHPVVLATLLSWMYFVRPTNSIVILGVSGFVFLFYRRLIVPYVLTGAAWLSLFLYYSWHNFGHLFPNYYRADRLLFDIFPEALQGNLVSPSRGLFVFVPVLFFSAYLLVRYWKFRPLRRLTWLALSVVTAMVVVISGFGHWWGGASFGPRFTTDAVPWFVLLGTVGIASMLRWRESHGARGIGRACEMFSGALLLAASIFINGRGALAVETWRWNPGDVSQIGTKLWDWRQPQFLAGLVPPPLMHEYHVISVGTQIDFGEHGQSVDYVWYGWSNAEPPFRWTDGREATLVFALNEIEGLTLKMRVLPFIREDLWGQQRVGVELNGSAIDSLILTENHDTEVSLKLPPHLLRPQNVLKFILPDAASPELLRINTDQRLLGIAVYWMEIERGTSSDGR